MHLLQVWGPISTFLSMDRDRAGAATSVAALRFRTNAALIPLFISAVIAVGFYKTSTSLQGDKASRRLPPPAARRRRRRCIRCRCCRQPAQVLLFIQMLPTNYA